MASQIDKAKRARKKPLAPKKSTKKQPRTKTAPYDPTATTTYPNQAAFDREVNTRARAQIEPTLTDISSRRRSELGAHSTRTREIGDLYNFDQQARQAGQDRLNTALQGLLGQQGVMGTQAGAGLSAALRQATAGNDAAAQQLGVAPATQDPAVLASLAAYSKGNNLGLAGEFGSHLARGAAEIGLTGSERREAGEREIGEHKANLKVLDQERKDARGTIPELRSQARGNLLQEILGNSQNKLAWRQFGLGEKQFGETVRSNKAGEALADKQFGLAQDQFGESKRARRFDEGQARQQAKLNQDQLDLARDELNAKIDGAATEEQAAAAETQAKRFDSAAQWLSGWLAPGDMDMRLNSNGKKVFSPKKYQQRTKNTFNSTMDQLMNRFGLSLDTAYSVMETADIYKAKASRFKRALTTDYNDRVRG